MGTAKRFQHVPPGTQEFFLKIIENFVTVKAKEIIQPEGPGGGKGYRGHEVASTLRRFAPLREPGGSPYPIGSIG